MSGKHSATPWQVMNEYDGATVVLANVDGETFSDGTSTFSYDFVCDTYGDGDDDSRSKAIAIANAAFIVTAVNSYASSQAEIERLKGKLTNCVHALTFAINGWDESDPFIQKLRATRDGAQSALSGSKD